jgi:curved DNA-binding protein CbpA
MTYYDVLGVSPSASPDDVKRAFHRKARQHHPDLGGGAATAAAMVEINAAWAVLGDPVRRRAYDRELALDWKPAEARHTESEDGDVAAFFGPEPEPPPRTLADAIVFLPVAFLALAGACFAFSTMTEAPVLLLTSGVLLAVAGLSFAATPLLVLRRNVKRRTSTDTSQGHRS